MTAPIVTVPAGLAVERLVGGNRYKQLFVARRGEARVALRLLRFGEAKTPLVPPSFLLPRLGSIIDELKLENVAPLLEAGETAGGFYAIEPWLGAGDLSGAQPVAWAALATRLAPIAADLATLHAARKWHGGIRPHRIRLVGDRATLVAFSWAAMATAFVQSLFGAVETRGRDFVAPELLERGPAGAGTALDVYAMAKTILGAADDVPADVRQLLEGAFASDRAMRPTMEDIAAALAL